MAPTITMIGAKEDS